MNGFLKKLISLFKTEPVREEKKEQKTPAAPKPTGKTDSLRVRRDVKPSQAASKPVGKGPAESRNLKKLEVRERQVQMPGSETQFPGASVDSTAEIIIGLDFGTCTTKVVIRDRWGGRVYAVPLVKTQKLDSNAYLLPTRLWGHPDGTLSLHYVKNAKNVSNLKLNFIDNADAVIFKDENTQKELNAYSATAIYLACVLQYVRGWFLNNCRAIYSKQTIRWYFNIGLPAVNIEDGALVEKYKKCAMTAWRLSMEKIPLSMRHAVAVRSGSYHATGNEGIHQDAVNVFPEIASEVVGYARSNYREDGMHLLIDIGAGTFDVATFNLIKNDGRDTYAFMLTDVQRYGAFVNCVRRLKHIDTLMMTPGEKADWGKIRSTCMDATKSVPQTLSEYMKMIPLAAARRRNVADSVRKFESQLEENVCSIVRTVVGKTKIERDPRSRQWNEGLPVYLCGGGANLSFYGDVVRSAEETLKSMGIKKFVVKRLPKPDGFQAKGLVDDQFHRLYVAYGLSYSYDEIGKIIPTRDIPDLRERPVVREIEEITKDLV